jgi:D-threo-aldose 1-dehydrogenase
LRSVSEKRGIALGAAALQYAMRHPAVTTVLVGARSAAEVNLDVSFAETPIADDVFEELDAVE